MKRSPALLAWLLVAMLDWLPGSATTAQVDSFRDESATARIGEDVEGSSADSDVVLREIRTFHRDLQARQWNDVVNHFWPAKVAARWPPPFEEPSAPPDDPSDPEESENSALCEEPEQSRSRRPTIIFSDRWARVVETCAESGMAGPGAARFDELWLLKFQGVWKIVYVR